MNMKKARDVSPFLLFEATADSEADCEGHVAANVDDDDNNDHDDDDAESCRGGLSDTSCVTTQMSGNGSTRSCFDSVMVKEEQQEEEEGKHDDDDDGEGEVNSYGRWARKQIVAVDSSSDKERMSETERSRLFWEACLAS